MDNKRQKIFVGISGGVDSSVSAYLLKKEGHNVHGVFVKTWSPEWLPCTWLDEKRDAMRVCAALDIPFHFLDAEDQYKKGVAEYMIGEYRSGRTPNPDVLCNRVIKFGVLWEYAKARGADAIATGHYAQTDDKYLIKGADESKDQTYFLWMLTKEELSHIRFPIGHLQKNEVRRIAEKAELFTAEKKDSQGICFLGDVDMREFLTHYITEKRGDVLDETGAIIGEHDGAWFYTLGERHGFHITAHDPNRAPVYVIEKNIDHNTITVSTVPRSLNVQFGKIKIALRDQNWLANPTKNKQYDAQIRYHGELIPVVVEDEQTLILSYEEVLPLGQSIVVYEGEKLIGGGVIDKIE